MWVGVCGAHLAAHNGIYAPTHVGGTYLCICERFPGGNLSPTFISAKSGSMGRRCLVVQDSICILFVIEFSLKFNFNGD